MESGGDPPGGGRRIVHFPDGAFFQQIVQVGGHRPEVRGEVPDFQAGALERGHECRRENVRQRIAHLASNARAFPWEHDQLFVCGGHRQLDPGPANADG